MAGQDRSTTTEEQTRRSTAPAVALDRVTSTYREGASMLTALEDISLEIGAGEFVAIIGPSGSGKSTLLDIVAGLIEPETGTVSLSGEALPASRRLGRTAYMRQRDLLLPWRTIAGNAALALEARGMPAREALARARERLPDFGLADFASAYPAQLSGGMRQRVAFLRTVLPGMPVLLLDEPFGALDALTRGDLQEWLLGLWERERQAVMLVTHDVEEAVLLADRVVVLTARPGRVAMIETIDIPRPRHRTLITDPVFIRHRADILAALGQPVRTGS